MTLLSGNPDGSVFGWLLSFDKSQNQKSGPAGRVPPDAILLSGNKSM